ncbi:MAG: transposase [Devosia sp.]
MSFITYKFRIKSGTRRLRRMSIAANQIWNFCAATQKEAQRRNLLDRTVRWPSGFALTYLTAGTSVHFGLHADTIGQICRRFAASRDQHRRCPKFRSSFGSRRALGWIPFRSFALKTDGDAVVYLKQRYRLWKSREIIGEFKFGAFVEDAQGHWFVTLGCEVADDLPVGDGVIGVDLGLTTFATTSEGTKINNLRPGRRYARALATAQRAKNKKRARAIHAKIANVRRHYLHEQSTKLARENRLIVVGDVNAAQLKKTSLAKSVSDASWSTFRNMLRYKMARRPGAVFIEADERHSSRVCSSCGTIPASSPKGRAALGVRSWVCSDCGALHDRDVNAARNILRTGLEHQPLVGEIAA